MWRSRKITNVEYRHEKASLVKQVPSDSDNLFKNCRKNGTDVTYGFPRTLSSASVFNIQSHMCYIKTVQLCDVSYVVV